MIKNFPIVWGRTKVYQSGLLDEDTTKNLFNIGEESHLRRCQDMEITKMEFIITLLENLSYVCVYPR